MKENSKLNAKDGRQVITPTPKGLYEVRSFLSNGEELVGICKKEELEKHFLMNFKQYNRVTRKEKEEQATYRFLNQTGDYYKDGVCNIQITLSKEDTGLTKENSLDSVLMHAKVESKLHMRGVKVCNVVIFTAACVLMGMGMGLAIRHSVNARLDDMAKEDPSLPTSSQQSLEEEKIETKDMNEEEKIRFQIYEEIMRQMEEENISDYSK